MWNFERTPSYVSYTDTLAVAVSLFRALFSVLNISSPQDGSKLEILIFFRRHRGVTIPVSLVWCLHTPMWQSEQPPAKGGIDADTICRLTLSRV